MKNYTIHLINILFFLCFVSISVWAQDPPPPPGNPSSENPGPVGDAPIDGGLGILLALGGAYGGYKVYKYKKDQKKEEIND
jgi:hypothetical protein